MILTFIQKTCSQYCIRDTKLTRTTWLISYQQKGRTFHQRSYELERKVRAIVDQQEKNGFAFNIKEAMMFLSKLEDEQHQLEQQAEEMFEPTEVVLKTKTKYIPFNIASRKQIAERLIEKGWKPTHKTEKGNVIVSEEILSKLKMPEAQMFSRYFLLQKRTGLLKSWIQECQEDE
jgi:DNA polymerase I-like protein with 3'-5' exonuclease and polymerase domains